MIKRKWKGHPTCYFCNENGTVSHLFFGCKVVNSNWGIIVSLIGANCVPNSIQQCWSWLQKWLPNDKMNVCFVDFVGQHGNVKTELILTKIP